MEVFHFVLDLLVYFTCFYVAYKISIHLCTKLPPGPIGLPIFGYLPFLEEYPHKTFVKLATKYGNILSMYLGNRHVIVLNDYKSIKEAFVFQGDIFNARPNDNPFSFLGVGLVAASEYEYNEHKKIVQRFFRNCGVTGNNAIESPIRVEIEHFISTLKVDLDKKKRIGKTFFKNLNISVVNNTVALIFGRRFDYEDKDFIALRKNEIELTVLYGQIGLEVFMTWLRYVPTPIRPGNVKRRMIELANVFNEFARKIINDHNENPNKYQPGDYIEMFENESKRLQNKNTYLFKEEWLLGNLHNLYGGAIETVHATIMWTIIYLIHNKDVQQRVHQELDSVIGRDRVPCYQDRLLTPYTEAVLMEVERIASIVPLALPHSNNAKTKLNGYDIPKDCYVIPNIWAVHHDPTLWKEPETFDPNRFLKEGKAIRPEYLIPFSIGKRQCIGLNMAKIQLYLYFTSLMQNFEFSSENDILPSLQPKENGLLLHPTPFEMLKIISR